jgi:hypothetical protein
MGINYTNYRTFFLQFIRIQAFFHPRSSIKKVPNYVYLLFVIYGFQEQVLLRIIPDPDPARIQDQNPQLGFHRRTCGLLVAIVNFIVVGGTSTTVLRTDMF